MFQFTFSQVEGTLLSETIERLLTAWTHWVIMFQP